VEIGGAARRPGPSPHQEAQGASPPEAAPNAEPHRNGHDRRHGERLEAFLTAAEPHGVPAIHDPDLARALARGAPGRPVPRETYGGVAAALSAGGVTR
jgi:hypothetical protein